MSKVIDMNNVKFEKKVKELIKEGKGSHRLSAVLKFMTEQEKEENLNNENKM